MVTLIVVAIGIRAGAGGPMVDVAESIAQLERMDWQGGIALRWSKDAERRWRSLSDISVSVEEAALMGVRLSSEGRITCLGHARMGRTDSMLGHRR